MGVRDKEKNEKQKHHYFYLLTNIFEQASLETPTKSFTSILILLQRKAIETEYCLKIFEIIAISIL